MEDLDRYINQTNAESKVVQCGLIHHQFETIHPFGDGNGRTGRLLIVLHLMQMDLLTAPLIYPSVYFERSRDEYCRLLQNVRDTGDWDQWIEYFARAIIFACKATVQFTHTIGKLRTELQQQATDIRKRASYGAVLNTFFEEPFLSIRQIADRLHVSHLTVESAIIGLTEQGIVFEITGKAKGRVFACRQVLAAVFGSEANEENM